MKIYSILYAPCSIMLKRIRFFLSIVLMGFTTLCFAQVDKTDLIKNPSFIANNADYWYGSPKSDGVNSGSMINYCIEKYNTKFAVWQIITGLENGYYQLTAKGFYRDGNHINAASAHAAGTESLHALLFANNHAVRLGSIVNATDIKLMADGNVTGYGSFVDTELGKVPNDMASAAAAFTLEGAYNNSVWVNVTDGTLRIGVKSFEDFESYSWAIFDDFHLYYYGTTQPTASADIIDLGDSDLTGLYVLYNVDTKKLLSTPAAGGDNATLTNEASTSNNYIFYLTTNDEVNYNIQDGTNYNILGTDWNSTSLKGNGVSNKNYTLSKLPNGYYNIVNTSATESNLLGWSEGDVAVQTNKTAENVNWQLIPVSSTDVNNMFHTLLRSTLGDADAAIFADYYALLKNESASISQLLGAVNTYNSINSLTTFLREDPEYQGDFVLYFFDDSERAWSRGSDGNNRWVRRNYDMNSGEKRTLTARVSLDQEGVILYNAYNANRQQGEENNYYNNYNNYYWQNSYSEYYVGMEVYLDNQLVRTINYQELGRDWYFFETLPKGVHTIKWVGICPEGRSGQYIDFENIRVMKTPTVSVNVVEAGELGLEILASKDSNGEQISRIQDVRKLKIKGKLNADDWAQIDNMSELFSIDLSESTVTNIPDNMFDRYSKSNSKSYLYEVKLPSTLEAIGKQAFRYAYIDAISFPSTLKTIGDEAFRSSYINNAILPKGVTTIGKDAFSYCYDLKEMSLPETLTTLGDYAFSHCYDLVKANLPTSLTYIPQYCFNQCHHLTQLTLHEGITDIRNDAFTRCWLYNPQLPSTLKSIGDRAFFNCERMTDPTLYKGISIGFVAFKDCYGFKNLYIPEEASMGDLCFANCTNIETVEFPSSSYTIGNASPILRYNSNMKTIRLKSSTVMDGSYKDRFFWDCGNSFTVQVPDFLLNLYKQDPYWKEYNLEEYATEEVSNWYVRNPLTLRSSDVLKGSPNLSVQFETGKLQIREGGPAMSFNNLFVDWSSQILCEREGVSILGDYTHCYFAPDDVWYFISLPFNFKPSDITTKHGAHVSLRYYDGAGRAANGATGNWKDLPNDTIVSAGSGFIMRTSRYDYVFFHAQNDGDKQNIFSTNEFVKHLDVNDSENAADKGWNLVGNPYQTYYNIHKLNTVAPITVYEYQYNYSNTYRTESGAEGWRTYAYGGNYKAYSVIDDDYAMLPNGAYFIQCPDEKAQVSYPVAGKQLTKDITEQTGVKHRIQQLETRKLIDLQLKGGDFVDQTRVVFNPEASMVYENICDASKFMAEDMNQPQLYTMDAKNIRYAINERPTENGIVKLGVRIPSDGTYTICLSRNRDAGTIILRDRLTNAEVNITNGDYVFDAKAGNYDSRFELIAQSQVTGIYELAQTETEPIAKNGGIQTNGLATIYSLDGRMLMKTNGGFVSTGKGVFIVNTGKQSIKIYVK